MISQRAQLTVYPLPSTERVQMLNGSLPLLVLDDEIRSERKLSSVPIGGAVSPAPPVLAWHTSPIDLLAASLPSVYFIYTATMRWLFSFLLLALLGAVQARSYAGSRLLVVLEEQTDREKYSVFLDDLAGTSTFTWWSIVTLFQTLLEQFRCNEEPSEALLSVPAVEIGVIQRLVAQGVGFDVCLILPS